LLDRDRRKPASVTKKARSHEFKFYFYINLNSRHASNGSLSNVLSRLAVGVRVDGDDETRWKEHEREGDQGEKRANASVQ
jgi:hypothetical protein